MEPCLANETTETASVLSVTYCSSFRPVQILSTFRYHLLYRRLAASNCVLGRPSSVRLARRCPLSNVKHMKWDVEMDIRPMYTQRTQQQAKPALPSHLYMHTVTHLRTDTHKHTHARTHARVNARTHAHPHIRTHARTGAQKHKVVVVNILCSSQYIVINSY